MVDSTDTLVAHIMVWCPMQSADKWVPVHLSCKPCKFCQSFCVDPNDNHITAVRCEYNKRKNA